MLKFLKTHSRHILASLCAILVVIICSLTLFPNGGAGLSDNGDFQRVMDASGLKMADSSHSRYMFKRFYEMELDEKKPILSLLSSYGENYLYKSPHSHFIKASKLLNYTANILTGKEAVSYDIFYLAFIYIIILAASAYYIILFFKKSAHQVLASVMFIIMFCDTGHLLYFNSLYGEAAQFVSLMMITALILSFIQKGAGCIRIIALYLAIYYFGGSKLANIPLALLTIAATFVFLAKSQKIHKIFLTVSALIVAVSLGAMYISIPSWMNEQTTYQSVFFGILKESPSPEQDIKEMGLPDEYICLANTHAYMSQYPIDITSDEFGKNFYQQIGKGDAVIFYAKHPIRFIKKCAEAISESVSIRPIYLGSSPHKRMGQTDKFSLWSNIRGGEGLFTNPYVMLPALLIFAFAALLASVYHIRKRESFKNIQICAMFLLLACGIWASLLLPIAGNGDADLLKHLYLFIHLTDILLYFIIMWAIHSKKSAIISFISLSAIGVLYLACSMPKPGINTVTFGTYNGKPIEWIATDNGDGTATMISKDVLFTHHFDQKGDFGSNLWADSHIRSYLNNEFLNCFTDKELSLICDTAHEVTLSQANSGAAQSGWHAPYWRASRSQAADMYEDTYRHIVTDKVYLPDTLQYSKGFFDSSGENFYLADPYGSSDSMVRFIDKNGVPVYCDAAENMGIRPEITITITERE